MKITDPSKFKAPHHRFNEIRELADKFRAEYWGSKSIPVDILMIAEENLDIQFIPIDSFKSNNDFEALLLDGGEKIVVDKKEYLDDRFLNRLRYSVAHKIAHKILHSELYDSFSYATVDEWIATIRAIPEDEYNWIEQQANEFAGRLLVPVSELKTKVGEHSASISLFKSKYPDSDINVLKDYVAESISKLFGVSSSVIIRRFDKEGLNYFFE
jgi:Zn-dependent peptidase ImmA (M78 family)